MKKTASGKKQKMKMTLDKLAQMSQGEFLAVGERFDKVDERFDNIDKRFDSFDSKFDALIEILRHMQGDIKEIKTDVQTVSFDYSELRTRVERLEKKVGLH